MSTQNTRMGRNPFEKSNDSARPLKISEEILAEMAEAAPVTATNRNIRPTQGFTFGFMFEIPLKFVRVGLKSVLVVNYFAKHFASGS